MVYNTFIMKIPHQKDKVMSFHKTTVTATDLNPIKGLIRIDRTAPCSAPVQKRELVHVPLFLCDYTIGYWGTGDLCGPTAGVRFRLKYKRSKQDQRSEE